MSPHYANTCTPNPSKCWPFGWFRRETDREVFGFGFVFFLFFFFNDQNWPSFWWETGKATELFSTFGSQPWWPQNWYLSRMKNQEGHWGCCVLLMSLGRKNVLMRRQQQQRPRQTLHLIHTRRPFSGIVRANEIRETFIIFPKWLILAVLAGLRDFFLDGLWR